MNDQELTQRMLDSAINLVNQRGMSTGLGSIAFDEVIREAGVSRTSAYRRWPSREDFYSAVLLELAGGASLPAPDVGIVEPAAQVVLDHVEGLGTAQGHRDLVVELLRVAVTADHQVVRTSPEWRTYRLLLASYEGIDDPEVRRAVSEALSAADRRAVDARARVYSEFTALLGYQLTAPLAGPSGFDLMSRAAGATMAGVLARISLGDAAMDEPRQMRAFGASRATEWTPAIYMMVATLLSYIEPQPGVEWTRQRIDDLVTAISQFSPQG